MRAQFLLLLTMAGFLAVPAHATLYKCQDASGNVTYTNFPCDKNGLKESKVVPPPPPVEPVPAKPEPAVETKVPEKRAADSEKKGSTSLQLIRSQESNERKCARLNESLGETMDEMDAARRQGYTPKQEAQWNATLKKLQAEKNKLGCF